MEKEVGDVSEGTADDAMRAMLQGGEVEDLGFQDDKAPSEAANVVVEPVAQAQPEAAMDPVAKATEGLRRELVEERKRRQDFEREIAELRGYQKATQQFAPRPEPEPEEAEIDFLDDAPAWLEQQLNRRLAPVFQQQQQQLRDLQIYTANQMHGQEAVQAAQIEFDEAIASGKLTESEKNQVLNSRNPWDAAVNWKKRSDLLNYAGNDMASLQKRVLEDAAKDPNQRAALLALLNGQSGAPASSPKTLIKLPPSLSSVGSVALQSQEQASGDDYMRQLLGSRR